MENKSGLKPLGRAVLVRPYEPEKMSSIIEVPDHLRGRLSTVEQRAIVIEVGANCWHDEPHPRAKAGDHVIVAALAGYQCVGPLDDIQYRAVNDRDIFLQIAPAEGAPS